MPAKNRARRLCLPPFRPGSQVAKPRLDRELVDDQKFQQKLDSKRFTDRIEREANEELTFWSE